VARGGHSSASSAASAAFSSAQRAWSQSSR
jgi:hypothetical protein